MKITGIEATAISVPVKASFWTSLAMGGGKAVSELIVKVHTDDGLVGLGEGTEDPVSRRQADPERVAGTADRRRPVTTGVSLAETLLHHSHPALRLGGVGHQSRTAQSPSPPLTLPYGTSSASRRGCPYSASWADTRLRFPPMSLAATTRPWYS
jgi:hypothetical protein